jgi:hypothetical protein
LFLFAYGIGSVIFVGRMLYGNFFNKKETTMKAGTIIDVDGKKITVLTEHDARGTRVVTPTHVGDKITICLPGSVMVGHDITHEREQEAILELVSKTSDQGLVIVRPVPIPGTVRRNPAL